MGLLIESRWRLVRRSFWLWMVLSIAGAYLTSFGTFFSSNTAAPHIPFFLTIASAAIGARLFSGGGSDGQGVWLRMLPVGRTRLFLLDCCIGLASATGMVLVLVFTWHALFPVARTSGDRFVSPSNEEWTYTAAQVCVTFAATAHFASAFTRLQAARQAGVAGWFSGLGLASAALLPGFVAPLALGAITLTGLVSAWRFQRSRGVGDGESRLLCRVKAADLAFSLPAQIVFVVIPIAILIHDWVEVPAPYLGVPAASLSLIGWLALGILALPWGWRELVRHGKGGATRFAFLALISTGVGVFLWRTIRSRGLRVECARCSRVRMEEIPTCPRCGSSGSRPRPASFLSRHLLPPTPWGVLAGAFVYLFAGSCVLGGQRYLRAYEIRTTLPGVEISLDGGEVQDSWFRGWSSGRRAGAWLGWWTDSQFGVLDLASRPPSVAISELRAGLAGATRRNLPPLGESVGDALAPAQEIRLSCTGFPCEIERITTKALTRNFVLGLDNRQTVGCPALGRLAIELTEKARNGVVDADDVQRACQLGVPMLVYLAREYHVAIEPRERMLELIDDVVAARYGVSTERAEESSARILGELDEVVANAYWNAEGVGTSREDQLELTFALVRGLAKVANAAPDEIEARIRRGNAFAALAAGMAGLDSCYPACRELFDSHMILTNDAYFAAWAMLALRPASAFDRLMREWESEPEPDHLRLLGLGNDPRTTDWLESVRADPPIGNVETILQWLLEERRAGRTLLQGLY